MLGSFLGTAMTLFLAQAEAGRGPEHNPVAYPAAVVSAGQARFTVLTPALIRMEWCPYSGVRDQGSGVRDQEAGVRVFEDRASLAFVNRRLPVPKFRASSVEGRFVIVTDELTLRYQENSGPFSKDNLSIELKVGGQPVVWTPGTDEKGNLRGTVRTLDGVSGACPLEPGLLSRDGWVLVDDSQRVLFDTSESEIRHPTSEIGWPWAARRNAAPASVLSPESSAPTPHSALHTPHSQDWYFFGYGRDYKRALRVFTLVAGRIPLPPRFVFGSWWSRYWAYSDEELKSLVAEFREHDVPLDVLVIDMDWHLDGWTGYTWNPKYFPDPDGFLKWVREQGLRATLNLHPADGVKKHEQRFAEFAEAVGVDPKTIDPILFNATDRRYVDAYFSVLHHPLEQQGIDFWWIDWQQGKKTAIEGLDPLFWLNYLHWTDMDKGAARRGGKRPILFSRWGGLGNHRYQIGFSGDTFSNWASLAFQPYFTATAGNVGYAYWSHDIGGHQPGVVDPELYARWIQFGALSPALRTHTTKNPKAERRIWAFPDEVFQAARKAFHLRYELIPYIYTMARKCYDTGLPLCRPLYYEWPDLDEAYSHGGQYLFGDDLLVAPVAQPISPLSGTAEVDVWIPPGEWTNWFTGRTYTGPTTATLMVPLDEIPLFVRSGGIIPAQPKMSRTGEKPVDPLILHIFPGPSGQTRVYEDDGETVGYQKNEFAWTPVSVRVDADGTRRITIGPTEGEFPGMLKRRHYEIHVRDVWPPKEVKVDGVAVDPTDDREKPGRYYHHGEVGVVIRLPARDVIQRTEISLSPYLEQTDEALLRKGLRGAFNLLDVAIHAEPPHPSLNTGCRLLWIENSNADPAQARAAAQDLIDQWRRFVQDTYMLHDAGELTIRRRRALRMLGLACRVTATPAADASSDIVATIEVKPTHAFSDLNEIAVNTMLFADEPWKIEGRREWKVTGLSGRYFSAGCRVSSPTPTTTGKLSGAFHLTWEGADINLPFEKVFLPSINAWWVSGPFDCPFETNGLDCVFPPEEKIDLTATYEGKDGKKIAWKEAKRPLTPGADLTDEFFVHLHDFFGERHHNAIAYAAAYLHSPRAMDASLAIGSDDGVAVWLNGQEVHRNQIGRPYSPKQDRVAIKLNEGVNTLLLKVSQGGGDWGFGVHVETPDGKPLPEVQASLSAEK